MALTKIRGEQIQDGVIGNSHINSSSPIQYSNLDLSASIVSSDLSSNNSVEQAVLDSKLVGLWDLVQNIASGTGNSLVVTTEILAAAATDTRTIDGSAKGILTTGTGEDGLGTQNYRVQIRNNSTGDPIEDNGSTGEGAAIYGQLLSDGSVWTLYFYNADGTAYTFASSTNIDFMFVEIFSLLTTPLKGFVTGMGFADIVGVAGTHNHDDRYYTETELSNGQLDSRYYTETELSNGQLDGRYYTETELDGGQLDSLYFTETELGSTGAGISGASIIGVEATGNLISTNVQSALVELQDDIDTLNSATVSLDDAYDNGSTITVDTTDVDWQLTDDVTFQVSDSGGSNILQVNALASGDTIIINGVTSITGDTDITGAFDVTGGATTLDGTTIDGTFSQSGGSVTLNGETNAVDIDGGIITIDGASIALTSTGNLSINDQYLTSAINLSESGVDDLATEFDYDSQTLFNWSHPSRIQYPASVMAAINANRQDIYSYVELLATEGAAWGVAAGTNLIGDGGITGVVPMNDSFVAQGTAGAAGTLREILNGLANKANGIKTYTSESAFTTDKSGTTYLPVNTLVYLKDSDRFAIVLVEGTGVVEGTDWDYLWGENQPLGGGDFVIDVTDTTTDSIRLNTLGGIDIDTDEGFALNDNSGAYFTIGTDGTVNLMAPTSKAATIGNGDGSTIKVESNGTIILYSGGSGIANSIDINSGGGVTIDAAADSHIHLGSTGIGEIQLVSSQEVDINSPLTQFHGDITLPEDAWINTGNISITSVDPSDAATISGYRGGTINTNNILTNPGFESGTGTDADSWSEDAVATRISDNKYYGDWSIRVQSTDTASNIAILAQGQSGLSASTVHNVSFWIKGTVGGNIQAQLSSGAAVAIVTGPTTYSVWTRVNVDLGTDNGASDTFNIIITGSGTEDYDFYLDALTLSEGTGIIDYFTDYESSLIFTIGDEDNDKIVFRSDGTSTQDLVIIEQDNVTITGNLTVSGTTTTIESSTMNVEDTTITLNSGQTGSASLNAFIEVERGDDDNVAIKWNESTNTWELTNDGTTYESIITGGSGSLSLDSAYNGGSTIAVDTTDVDWNLSASRDFRIYDGTDADKFVISAGTGTSSIKIDTSGGLDIDTNEGVSIVDDSGATISIATNGAIGFTSPAPISATSSGTSVEIVSDTNTSGVILLQNNAGTGTNALDINVLAGGMDVDVALGVTIDSSGISLDSDAASNFTVDGAGLTLSTTTSGTVTINSAGTIDIDGVTITIDGTTISMNSSSIALASTGNLTLKDQYLSSAINLSESGTTGLSGFTATSIIGAINEVKADFDNLTITMDGVYDGESATTRIVTVDDGSIEYRVTDDYEFNVADSTGTDIFSIKALATGNEVEINGAIDANTTTFNVNATDTSSSSIVISSAGTISIDSDAGFSVTDDSGSSLSITSGGDVTIDGASISIDGTGASNMSVTGANLTLSTITSGTLILASAGSTTIDGTSISIDGTGASNITVTGANLTLSTITSGTLILASAGDVTIDGASISIDGTGASNITVTGANLTIGTATSGELYFDDARTAAIAFSDASNSSFDGSATSIIGAINEAFNKGIDIGYEEIVADGDDVTNDYVVTTLSDAVAPISGISFPATPATLRGAGYYIVVYLNGARLGDTEWRYNYSGGTKSIAFDGSDDITLVVGDKIMIDAKKV